MNTSKQVNIMVVLIFLSLVMFGAYTLWDPIRANEAEEFQDEVAAERGARLFSKSCRLCHGDRGEGGALGGRQPQAFPLNTAKLQGFADTKRSLAADVDAAQSVITVVPAGNRFRFEKDQIILVDRERMTVKRVQGNLVEVGRAFDNTEAASHLAGTPIFFRDDQLLAESENLITNTVTCGRIGTAMPFWGESQGGILNDEQIRQLVKLITSGRWDTADAFAKEADATGVHLAQTVSASRTELSISDVTPFAVGDPIRIDDERMVVLEVRESSLVVERGALASEAAEHVAGVEVLNQAMARAPENPSITGSPTEQVCGQFIRGPLPTQPPTSTPRPGTVAPPTEPTATPTPRPPATREATIRAITTIQFDLDEIVVKAGTITITMINEDVGIPHNFAVYTDDTASEPIAGANEGICTGPCEVTLTFEITEPGTYFFRCDVHPTIMTGDLIVVE